MYESLLYKHKSDVTISSSLSVMLTNANISPSLSCGWPYITVSAPTVAYTICIWQGLKKPTDLFCPCYLEFHPFISVQIHRLPHLVVSSVFWLLKVSCQLFLLQIVGGLLHMTWPQKSPPAAWSSLQLYFLPKPPFSVCIFDKGQARQNTIPIFLTGCTPD